MDGRQLILNIIEIFTSTHKINFYTKVFDAIDLSGFPDSKPSKYGPTDYSRRTLLSLFCNEV